MTETQRIERIKKLDHQLEDIDSFISKIKNKEVSLEQLKKHKKWCIARKKVSKSDLVEEDDAWHLALKNIFKINK